VTHEGTPTADQALVILNDRQTEKLDERHMETLLAGRRPQRDRLKLILENKDVIQALERELKPRFIGDRR